MIEQALLLRVQDLCSMLPDDTRNEGQRLLALARKWQAWRDQPEDQMLESQRAELRRELQRLVELLSRRSAKAIAVAKLGRAVLSDIAGDERTRDSVLAEADVQLLSLGL